MRKKERENRTATQENLEKTVKKENPKTDDHEDSEEKQWRPEDFN